jgi:hypothetical protein
MRTWTPLQLARDLTLREPLPPFVGVRHAIPGSQHQRYGLTPKDALAHVRRINGAPKEFIISEHAPDDFGTLQGYVMRSERYLELDYYLGGGLLMRQIFERELDRHIAGAGAVALLRQHLDAPSWDCLQDIWDRFPSSVVELSAYSVGCGTLGWNTLFWEVRDY